jgi:hypothetical protein
MIRDRDRMVRLVVRWAAMVLVAAGGAGRAAAGDWYQGDLHSHSTHSDGDSPVGEVLASVEARGLDFFALTDHDTSMNGVPTHWSDPEYQSDRVILLYGVEWTTGRGHANVWAAEPFDYAALWQANRDLDADAGVAASHAAGALFSINHPLGLSLRWQYPIAAGVDCVEIWNGPMLINLNCAATNVFWDDILRDGRRVVGVGGSDTHQLHGWQSAFTGHGMPTTWVYADERTARGILAGIAGGHVTISFAPWAPRLELAADADNDGRYETMMGDSIAATGAAVPMRLRLRDGASPGDGAGDVAELPAGIVAHLKDGHLGFWDWLTLMFILTNMETTQNLQFLTLVEDGDMHRVWFVAGSADEVRFEETAAGATYYRAELFGATNIQGPAQLVYGFRTAATNPVYVGD